MGTASTASFKRNWFYPRVKACMAQGLECDMEKAIAEFCIGCNSTKRTAMDCLNSAIVLGCIIKKEGKLWTPEGLAAKEIEDKFKNFIEKKEDGTKPAETGAA